MSLFDVFKYPISDNCTCKDLQNIPSNIIPEWIEASGMGHIKDSVIQHINNGSSLQIHTGAINILRSVILNHECI